MRTPKLSFREVVRTNVFWGRSCPGPAFSNFACPGWVRVPKFGNFAGPGFLGRTLDSINRFPFLNRDLSQKNSGSAKKLRVRLLEDPRVKRPVKMKAAQLFVLEILGLD